jgi:hypothetical protein
LIGIIGKENGSILHKDFKLCYDVGDNFQLNGLIGGSVSKHGNVHFTTKRVLVFHKKQEEN